MLLMRHNEGVPDCVKQWASDCDTTGTNITKQTKGNLEYIFGLWKSSDPKDLLLFQQSIKAHVKTRSENPMVIYDFKSTEEYGHLICTMTYNDFGKNEDNIQHLCFPQCVQKWLTNHDFFKKLDFTENQAL